MKFINKLTPVALATAMALGSLAAPLAAQADVSSSATISSMYLWRGQDISGSAPVMTGEINYAHSSGAYVDFWLSSLGWGSAPATATETDWTVGYSGSAGDLGYDVGYYKFWYPEANQTTLGAAAAEVYLGLTYKDAGFKIYHDAKGDSTYDYLTVSYGMGPFSALVGYDKVKDNAAAGSATTDSYKHIDLTYAATDRLSFTYSKAFAVGDTALGNSYAGLGQPPVAQFMVSYSLPVDLK